MCVPYYEMERSERGGRRELCRAPLMKRDDAFDLDREKKAWLRPWLLERRERERERVQVEKSPSCLRLEAN